MNSRDLSKYIDHTILKATATKHDIIQLCNEAKEHNFFSVCVNSCYAKLAKEQLKNTEVKVCCVIGFPLGAMSTIGKVEEAKQALIDGAEEIDMVINLGFLKSFEYNLVLKDIEAVKAIMPKNILKVILETCYLTEDELIKASELAIQAGANFIKTSTGFGTGGATIKDVEIMKNVAKQGAKVKASGGIKDYQTAIDYINLGAERLGTSSGIAIVTKEASNTGNY